MSEYGSVSSSVKGVGKGLTLAKHASKPKHKKLIDIECASMYSGMSGATCLS
jgi:hypothetical protein